MQFDVILSEWMGYFLLFESMLDTVLYARDRWLKPDGIMMPNNCRLYLTASSDQTLHERNLEYWDNVYGFQMTCMRTAVVKEASVMVVNDSHIVTDSCLLKVCLQNRFVMYFFYLYIINLFSEKRSFVQIVSKKIAIFKFWT